jgi:hypothetical protein
MGGHPSEAAVVAIDLSIGETKSPQTPVAKPIRSAPRAPVAIAGRRAAVPIIAA